MHNRISLGNNPPLVSVILFAYQQEKYIKETLISVLYQDYVNLEIIISDDCSTDNTFQIIQNTLSHYNGLHRNNITAKKNRRNLGVCSHVNEIVKRCNGNLIVVCAGDDIFFPTRVSEIVEAWQKTNASLFCSNAIVIDENGNDYGNLHYSSALKYKLYTLLDVTLTENYGPFFGAGMAYTKDVFVKFGDLPLDIENEDVNLLIRGVLLNGNYYISKPLLKYRIHKNNLNLWSQVLNASSVDQALIYFSKSQKLAIDNRIKWIELLEMALDKTVSNHENKIIITAISSVRRVINSLELYKVFASKKTFIERLFLFLKQLKFILKLSLKEKLKLIILTVSPHLFIRILVMRRRKV